MNPLNCDSRQKIDPFLILILEYGVFELIPHHHEPRNINEIYQILEGRQTPPRASLIERHIVAPTTNHEWMGYLSLTKSPADSDQKTYLEVERKQKRRR